VIDVVARFIPGVLGAEDGAQDDSYASGMLEGPQYTRPATFKAWSVPEILRSGHHAAIARWKRKMALQRTWLRQPSLLTALPLSEDDQHLLREIKQELGEPDES
jgi:tRNA (guanine37-N1)-methyltransferase